MADAAHGHDASHADAATGPAHADATPVPATHKCSACDACASAAALPAQAPRLVPPEAGTASYQRMGQGALRFLTDGPDRPPRGRAA